MSDEDRQRSEQEALLHELADVLRCVCMTTRYGGTKQCRATAVRTSRRGWCRRHEHWNGDNYWRVAGDDGEEDQTDEGNG